MIELTVRQEFCGGMSVSAEFLGRANLGVGRHIAVDGSGRWWRITWWRGRLRLFKAWGSLWCRCLFFVYGLADIAKEVSCEL